MAGRAFLIASAILSFHAGGALDAEHEAPEHADFHSFMRKYDRQYKQNSEEYHTRLTLFARRSAEAEAHNARANRLWTAGVNSLFDRTEAELAQLRGWRGAARVGAAITQRYGSGSTFLNQRGRSRALPQEFMNWTSLQSAKHIINQGRCGSCWAAASIAVLQQHLEIYHPQSKRTFSAQELVSCVPNPHDCGGTGGCRGATIELAFNWVLNLGLAEESETPYEARDGKCKRQRGDGLMQLHERNLAISIHDLTTPSVHLAPEGSPGLAFGMQAWERLPENSYESLLRALFERGPVGVSVAAHAWTLYRGGVFDGCQKNSVIDHAVVLVAYGKDKKLGKLFYLIQNSWGPDWGEHGRIRLLRREDDDEQCGVDNQPEAGTGCKGGPKQVKVCGMCGVLYDSTVPHFRRTSA